MREFRIGFANARGALLVACLGAVLLGDGFFGGARAFGQLEDPTFRDRLVSRRVAFYLENLHIRGVHLDDSVSQKIFDSYIGTLDPVRVYFLRSDIKEFRESRNDLDDKLREGDLDFAHAVFARFLVRLEEAVNRLDALLEGPIDFTADEYLEADRKNAKFAVGAEDMDELWRKRTKLLLLERVARDETLEEAKERVSKMHRDFLKRMKETNNTELLQMYVTAATTTYDPHTTYLSPDTLENFEISMRLQLEGIGAALLSEDGYVVVSEVIPGGAAARDGRLQARDKILEVAEGKDGEFVDLFNMRLTEVVKKIRGKRGTTVRLKIEHEKSGTSEIIEIVRAKVVLQDREARGEVFEIDADDRGDALKVGVIDLPSFYMDMSAARTGKGDFKSTSRDVRKILEGFKKDSVDAVVIDLRYNGGGSLREAIDMTGLFIDDGPVVQIKRPGGETDVQKDLIPGKVWHGPLVVMTSKLSASASEIFAGAIQDYDRGLVVGDRATHGKGSVQELLPLDRGKAGNAFKLGAIKITISQFYRPSGDSTQNLGVVPDIELPSIRSHLAIGEADLDRALAFDRIAAAPFEKEALAETDLVAQLAARSKERVGASEDFKLVESDIQRYLKVKDRKLTPLNREKFLEDYKRRQAKEDATNPHAKKTDGSKEDDSSAKAEADPKSDEATDATDANAILRDYYLDEVFAITRDYVSALNKS